MHEVQHVPDTTIQGALSSNIINIMTTVFHQLKKKPSGISALCKHGLNELQSLERAVDRQA